MGAVDAAIPPHLVAAHPDKVDQWDPDAGGWLVRQLPDGKVVHVVPLLYTAAVLVSRRRGAKAYQDRWCYSTTDAAFTAAEQWTGDYPGTEPTGWHRHPFTGRRRPDGDPAREHIQP